MHIAAPALQQVIYNIILRGGSDESEAAIVATHLLDANLAGHDSHGVGMIPTYVEHLHAGLLTPNRPARCVSDSGSILLFDGDAGYGQRVAREAMQVAIDRCRDTGLTLMGLRNAHHIGRIGAYGEQAINAGLVSLHFVNVTDHRPLVAPFRGSDARFGTNPLCIAIPGTAHTAPILLDMATSRIALGKVRVAMNKGEQVAAGTLIDAHGQPTTDPQVMFQEPCGALLPIGEHKGYGLALLCELLSGLLTGGGTIQPGNPRRGSIVNHMLSIIIDPTRLVAQDWLHAELDALIAYAKASPPAAPALPVQVAGEPEQATRALRLRDGIPLDPVTWAAILAAGERVGLSRREAEVMLASV